MNNDLNVAGDTKAAAPNVIQNVPDYILPILNEAKQQNIKLLAFHPASELLPWPSEEEFRDLCEDISRRGLQEPIVTHDDQILDGRTRCIACISVGKPAVFKKWDANGDPVEYVIGANLHRRHLSDDQRAAIAASLQQSLASQSKHERATKAAAQRHGSASSEATGAPKQRARAQAAKTLNVSQAKVRKAEEVHKLKPELLQEVKSGRLPLAKAHAQSMPVRATDDTLLAALHAVERKLTRLHPESMDEVRLQALLARTQSISDFHEAGMCRLKELQAAKKPASSTVVETVK
jgi:ParB-like chromosome segregation protein Spo0J